MCKTTNKKTTTTKTKKTFILIKVTKLESHDTQISKATTVVTAHCTENQNFC